ncbi:hypothetical protein ACQ4PT_068033 [Festuca glaucescens]
MDRYQRVERPRPESAIAENEIRITAQGLIRNYVSYATSLLQDRKIKEIVLKAMGQAISKSVAVTEIIKKRIPGLYQDTNISSVSITDVWEPIEEGLVPLSFLFFLPSYHHIQFRCTEDSNLFQCLLVLQIGDDSICFNDFNNFVSSRAGPKLPRVSIKPHLMLNSPGNSSAFSRHHHSCVNLASHQLIMKTPMRGVVAGEGAAHVVGVGVEVVMVDMEITKVGITKAGTIKVDTIKVGITKMVGTMIMDTTKMVGTMIIKVGMAVDMATTKADKETT